MNFSVFFISLSRSLCRLCWSADGEVSERWWHVHACKYTHTLTVTVHTPNHTKRMHLQLEHLLNTGHKTVAINVGRRDGRPGLMELHFARSCMDNNYYIDGCFYVSLSRSIESSAGLKVLKPPREEVSSDGSYLICKLLLLYYLHFLYRSTFILLSVKCWVFSGFRNLSNSDLDYRVFNVCTWSFLSNSDVDYRILNVCMWSFLCMHMHTGVGHTDSKSANNIFDSEKKVIRFFLWSWWGSYSGQWCHRILSLTFYQLSHPVTPNGYLEALQRTVQVTWATGLHVWPVNKQKNMWWLRMWKHPNEQNWRKWLFMK